MSTDPILKVMRQQLIKYVLEGVGVLLFLVVLLIFSTVILSHVDAIKKLRGRNADLARNLEAIIDVNKDRPRAEEAIPDLEKGLPRTRDIPTLVFNHLEQLGTARSLKVNVNFTQDLPPQDAGELSATGLTVVADGPLPTLASFLEDVERDTLIMTVLNWTITDAPPTMKHLAMTVLVYSRPQ